MERSRLPHDADSGRLLRYCSAMRAQSVRLSLPAIALLALCPVWAQQAATTKPVTITVSDLTGTGITHAKMRLVPIPDSAPTKLETDDHGRLSLNLQPGSYSVFVSAQGFQEATLHFDVAAVADDGNANASAIETVPVVLQPGETRSPAVYPKDSLALTAESYHAPVVLSPAEFRALPHVSATVHNPHTDAEETYSGVPLATLLAMINAPIGKELHGEALATYLVATGTDGYSAVLSLAEADPSFHGGQILVADTRDGQPLGKSGPFQMIVSEDKRPARWVHNLAAIALQSAH